MILRASRGFTIPSGPFPASILNLPLGRDHFDTRTSYTFFLTEFPPPKPNLFLKTPPNTRNRISTRFPPPKPFHFLRRRRFSVLERFTSSLISKAKSGAASPSEQAGLPGWLLPFSEGSSERSGEDRASVRGGRMCFSAGEAWGG